ncbi:sensor histidine kinase [Aneurinibacillus aneurinilyticus]|jgi:signal transduction histidine kinase|uniref:sensor histidine kinase n=1 Tax=Aneurinibacillus aneurinilyticus TaxID=1391 RepID=UPI0023EFB326|nr:sensor histidine kinase [Aneurinibacillus aneurinilyticus]MCI1696090.1 sensor histidine kinase [Aneurinibacillus aneurinilyticus]
MNIRTFLLDRLAYLLLYAINLFVILLVIQLSLFHSHQPLSSSIVFYIILLSCTGLLFILVFDYIRQRPFYHKCDQLYTGEPSFEDVHIQGACTREQWIFEKLLERQHAHYKQELFRYRKQQEQHRHFVHRWVHQMKTPVSVIDLLLQQANNGSRDNDPYRWLTSLQEENEKLAHGLDMMLYNARLDLFEKDFVPRKISIVHMLRSLIHEYKKLFIRTSIFPKLEADQEEVIVETDEKWLRFVFQQLLTNSIKYSSRTDKRSKIVRMALFHNDQGWHVRISDEGVGIPPQDVSRVFDAFFTGENGRAFAESTGMGLYLSKQICDRLGHGLAITSEHGKGTEVTVSFYERTHLYHDANMTKL